MVTRRRDFPERLFYPRLVLCFHLLETAACVVLRLIIDSLVINTTEQNQILVAIDDIGRALAIAGTAR